MVKELNVSGLIIQKIVKTLKVGVLPDVPRAAVQEPKASSDIVY